MKSLVITPKFRRAYRKLIKQTPKLQSRIDEILRRMEDVFAPALETHKLFGALL